MLRGVRSGENAIQSNVLATDIRSANQSQEHCSFPRSPDLTLHSVCEWDLAHPTKSCAVAYIHWNEVNFSLPCLKAPRAPGAYCLLSTQWFQVQWRSDWAATGIAAKEMFPLVLVWGSSWCGHTITFKSDNTSSLIQLGKDPYLSAASSSFSF